MVKKKNQDSSSFWQCERRLGMGLGGAKGESKGIVIAYWQAVNGNSLFFKMVGNYPVVHINDVFLKFTHGYKCLYVYSTFKKFLHCIKLCIWEVIGRNLFSWFISVTMVVLLWAVVWSITGIECLPGGNLFGIIILFYCAIIGGKLLGLIKLPTLPPLPRLLGKC